MNLLTQIKHKTQKGEEVIMDIGAKASNVLPENFVEQKERSNLAAKDKLPVIFGKLSKWYADLRPVAWTGSYSDLTNKPTIPEGSAANYQVANNDTTEAEGFVADARIVRTHGLEIDGLSRDLSAMNDNGAITGMDAREDGVYITYVPADGADPVSKKLGSNGITYLGDMPYTCTQDYGDCTLLTFCHQKTATQNVTIKNLNGSYNIKQIVPAHIGGTLCFLAIVDVTSLNKGATIDTESSDTKRVFII
ncbi:MAG: hypothetical protein ACLTY0_07760 [Lachnospiraceae bacterium]